MYTEGKYCDFWIYVTDMIFIISYHAHILHYTFYTNIWTLPQTSDNAHTQLDTTSITVLRQSLRNLSFSRESFILSMVVRLPRKLYL